jgi:Ca2+-binding EF-hand superfamily protein
MSISGIGSGMSLSSMLSTLLNHIDSTQSTSSGSGTSSSTGTSSGFSSSTQSDTSLTGSTVAQLSSEVLSLLMQMQSQQQSGGCSASQTSNGTTAAITASASSTTSPVQSLFDSMDSDGNGTVSQSEIENYIEKQGGTKAEADTVFGQLDQNSSAGGLTEQQLALDVQNSAPPTQPPSPKALAGFLFKSIDANGDGSITRSELESFVTSSSGTIKEADQIYSNIDSNNSGSISSSQFEQAISTATGSSNVSNSSGTTAASASPLANLLARLASGSSISAVA